LEHQVKRIETMVHRAESVLAQMTVAISERRFPLAALARLN